jgi:hypothetical protein
MNALNKPPAGFQSITTGHEILALAQKSKANHNFIGVVTDSKGLNIARGTGKMHAIYSEKLPTSSDYQHAFEITDQYNMPLPVVFFTKSKETVPHCHKGDIILIRTLKYNGPKFSFQNFISTFDTTFKVLAASDFSEEAIEAIAAGDTEIKSYLTGLTRWAKSNYPSAGKNLPRPPVSKKKNNITDLGEVSDKRENKFYTLAGEVVRIFLDTMDKAVIYITDYTENDSFHEYFEGDNTNESDSKVPPGKQTLQLTLFKPHDEWVKKQRNLVGQLIQANSVHIKYTNYQGGSQLEGVLHTDERYHNKVSISYLSPENPYYATIKQRREEYQSKVAQQRPGQDPPKLTKTQVRKEKRRLEKLKLEEQQKEAQQFGGIDAPKSLEFNKRSKPSLVMVHILIF